MGNNKYNPLFLAGKDPLGNVSLVSDPDKDVSRRNWPGRRNSYFVELQGTIIPHSDVDVKLDVYLFSLTE